MAYGEDYRAAMTGFMDRIDDDTVLANEWHARLSMPGRERWMNEATGARLVKGLNMERFRDMVAWSLVDDDPTPSRMVEAVRNPSVMKDAMARVLNDPTWRPDPARLTAADLDLNVLAELGADKASVFGLKAFVSWLASDLDRAQICLVASPAPDTAYVCVAWCLRQGILPAGRTATPVTANVPDLFRPSDRNGLPELRFAPDVAWPR